MDTNATNKTASSTFKENYETLERIATQLRTQKELDIDSLIPMVDEALGAYKVCKERLEAIKAAFGERMPAQFAGEN